MTQQKEIKERTGTYTRVELEALTRAWADPVNREAIKAAFKKAGLGSDARQYLDHLMNLVKNTADLINSSISNRQSLEETRKLIQSNPRLAGAASKLDGFLDDISNPGIEAFEARSNGSFVNTLKRFDFTGQLKQVEALAVLIGDQNSDKPRAYLMSTVPGIPASDRIGKVDLSPILSMTFPASQQ